MNDLSVIIAQNERAQRLNEIEQIKQSGKVPLVQAVAGLFGIGDVKVFDTIQDARTAAQGLAGSWYVA